MATTYYNPVTPYYMPPPPPPNPYPVQQPDISQPIGQPQQESYKLEIPDGVQNIEYITLDISKKTRARFAPLTIRQGDRNGTALIVTIVDTTDGVIRNVNLEMADVYFEMVMPDKESYYRSEKSEEIVENRAVLIIDEQWAAAQPGNTQAYIRIEQDETSISTQPFRVKIMGNAAGSGPNVAKNIDYNEAVQNKPAINGVELVGDKDSSEFEISYNDLVDLPMINGHVLSGDLTTEDLDISAASGVTDYNDLLNKPTINGRTVEGDLTTDDLDIDTVSDYNDLANIPTINDKPITGSLTTEDVVDVDGIVSQLAEGVDATVIAQQIIDSGILADELIQTASVEQIREIVAGNNATGPDQPEEPGE